MNRTVEKISHVDLLVYNMRTNLSISSASKQTEAVYQNVPRILSLEDQQSGKKKEQRRDAHMNIYREFFSNTSNSLKCCVQNYWLASEEVVLMDIHTAASLGDCGGIDAALARSESINNCTHVSGWTPLMFAASRNHLVAVKRLILNGANVCIHSKEDGRTALALAVAGGSCETVATIVQEALQQKGAGFKIGTVLTLEAGEPSDKERFPWLQQDFRPLYLELRSVYEHENLGLDSWDHYGWTPLMHSILFGTSDVVKLLMMKGSKINVFDINGKTPLIVAIECMRHGLVFNLLNNGADPTVKTKKGRTTVEYAVRCGHPQIINMVEACNEFISEWNNDGLRTVIILLASLNLRKYIPVFIEHNIDINKLNRLTEDELRSLGLTNMGPRKKVLSAVRDRMAETI